MPEHGYDVGCNGRWGGPRGDDVNFISANCREFALSARSKALQQPLDIVELLLRTADLAVALAQLFDDAASALHVDLARHLHVRIVAVFMPAQRPAQRVGIVVGARPAEASQAALSRPLAHLLLHRLGKRLRALAQGIERSALGIHGAVGVSGAELSL